MINTGARKQNNENDYSQRFAFLRRPAYSAGPIERERERFTSTGEHTKTRAVLLSTQPHHKNWKVDVIFFSRTNAPAVCAASVNTVGVCAWINEWMCSAWWVYVSVSAFDWIRSGNIWQLSPNMDPNFYFSCLLNELTCPSHRVLGHESNLRMFACLVDGQASEQTLKTSARIYFMMSRNVTEQSNGAGSVDGKVSWELWMDWMSVPICIVRNAASTAVYIRVMQCCVRVAELITCTLPSSIVRMLGIGLKLLCKRLLGLLQNARNVYVLRRAIAMPNSMLPTKKMRCGCVREILPTVTVWKKKRIQQMRRRIFFCGTINLNVIEPAPQCLPCCIIAFLCWCWQCGHTAYIQFSWICYDIRECSTSIEQCARLKMMMLEHKCKEMWRF